MQQLCGTHCKAGKLVSESGLESQHYDTEFVCGDQRSVSGLCILTTTTPMCGAHGWERSFFASLFYLFYFYFFAFFMRYHFWTRGLFFFVERATLKKTTERSRAQCWCNERDGGLCKQGCPGSEMDRDVGWDINTAAAALMSCGLKLAGASEAGTWRRLQITPNSTSSGLLDSVWKIEEYHIEASVSRDRSHVFR